ncbi:RNA polymerase Rpb7 [Apodospora peruviana]|uniref:DNA-directed RNA polymerase subunit n=1 Tax=Apodospora peruviana TaxID=516989 RepID=A0AAE0ISE3_9PEZI|nr:RNA polymerase Rpb7 [Apodospora peruviana]
MFFLHNLERQVTLHPSYFGRNMHELVTTKLVKDVEGTCAGDYYIIAIMDAFDVSEGRILPGSGLAEFTVGYRAVVWRPYKGEVVDGITDKVNPHGFSVRVGPLEVFTSRIHVPAELQYDANATPPQYTNNADMVIEVGTHVRLRIMGIRTEVNQLYAIGTINGDFLGCLQA